MRVETFVEPDAPITRTSIRFAPGATPAYAPPEAVPSPATRPATCVPCPPGSAGGTRAAPLPPLVKATAATIRPPRAGSGPVPLSRIAEPTPLPVTPSWRQDSGAPSPATREVDGCDDPSREVGMRRDTTVEDRDTDSLAGHSELAPDLGRPDLKDAGARRIRGTVERIECRGYDLVERDVRDVTVIRELQDLGAREDRRYSTDDRQAAAHSALSSLHRRAGPFGVMPVVLFGRSTDDDGEIVIWFVFGEREQLRADLGIAVVLRSRRSCLRRRHDDGHHAEARPTHAHPSPSAHATPPTRPPAAFHSVER